jgi:hypothetical protein
VAVELKAGLICDQRLKQRLALKEREARDVPSAEVQKIESVIDNVRAFLERLMRQAMRQDITSYPKLSNPL